MRSNSSSRIWQYKNEAIYDALRVVIWYKHNSDLQLRSNCSNCFIGSDNFSSWTGNLIAIYHNCWHYQHSWRNLSCNTNIFWEGSLGFSSKEYPYDRDQNSNLPFSSWSLESICCLSRYESMIENISVESQYAWVCKELFRISYLRAWQYY